MKLFNRNYIIITLSCFLMFISFYLLMPIIAIYCIDEFNASPSTAGLVLSSYIVSALLTRPFSGYLVDKYDYRKLYTFILGTFAILLIGYLISTSIGELIITRILLGISFAIATTAGNTLVIDVLPSEKRSEGIGYYGAFTVISMAIGPMIGLYMLDIFSYTGLFLLAIASSALAFILILFIKTKPKPSIIHKELISLDRFVLKKGIGIASIITLTYFMYGTLMVYISLYVKECGINLSSSVFFLLFAIGIILSRIATAKALNAGKQILVLQYGLSFIIMASVLLIYFFNDYTFILSSIILGVGFGISGPAIQTKMINMASHNRRGTATATYYLALDIGSGLGMLIGGTIASLYNYQAVFLCGAILIIIALLFLNLFVKKRI